MKEILTVLDYIYNHCREEDFGEVERVELTKKQLATHLTEFTIRKLQELVDSWSYVDSNGTQVVNICDIENMIIDLKEDYLRYYGKNNDRV